MRTHLLCRRVNLLEFAFTLLSNFAQLGLVILPSFCSDELVLIGNECDSIHCRFDNLLKRLDGEPATDVFSLGVATRIVE